jgi:dihydrofolate reductase
MRLKGASCARARPGDRLAKLIYSALTSLDLYVADQTGNFDWAVPDEEVHQFVNDLLRPIGTQLYGRRMYEVLVAWESDDIAVGQPPVVADFAAIWRGADKIVYSRSLESASSARTTIERDFDPEVIRAMKASADRDISIGGPVLAANAIRAGLVDEIHLFLNPILVGRGNPALPDDVRVPLELLDERRFDHGVVYLRYRVVA